MVEVGGGTCREREINLDPVRLTKAGGQGWRPHLRHRGNGGATSSPTFSGFLTNSVLMDVWMRGKAIYIYCAFIYRVFSIISRAQSTLYTFI